MLGLLDLEIAQLIAAATTIIAQIITVYHAYQHRRTPKKERVRIITILYMVPILSSYSCLMLIYFTDDYIYFHTIKDCYEAYVLYHFLSLCYNYLGGDSNIEAKLCGKVVADSWFKSSNYTARLHNFCKYGTLQYCFFKCLCSLMIIFIDRMIKLISYLNGTVENCTSGYIFFTVVSNISGVFAASALFVFFRAVRDLIKPDPILKFFTVTTLIFFINWQGWGFLFLEYIGVIFPATDGKGNIIAWKESRICHNFLVSIEVVVVAILLRFAFPASAQATPTRTVTMQTESTGSINRLL